MDTSTATAPPADPAADPAAAGPAHARAAVDVRAALRTRDFRLLFSAYAISAIGSEVTVLALPLAAALLLGATPLQMGLLTAAGTAPYIGFALVVGAWVDRLRRRRPLMIAADLAAAAALLTVPLAWALGPAHGQPADRGRAGRRGGPGDLPADLHHPPARRRPGPRR